MKSLITCLLILSFLLVSTPVAKADTTPQRFEAEMLVTKPDGKSTEEVPIDIVIDGDNVRFEAKGKDAAKSKTFKNSDISSAEYTYSKKPRYATGAVLALAVTVFLLPIMFTKSKKHWMTVNGANDYAVLKLKKSNYRLIMPAMKAKGINVIDSGNQNKKGEDKKDEAE